jgi:uncharacterized protein YceH (UPF0502 family)
MPSDPANHDASAPAEPKLTAVEARVLGCLMEKQRTTPDAYPLTLNALVAACNQKTSRNPVMNLETSEVGHTVNELRDRGLIHASFSSRAERYDHKMVSSFDLDREAQAVLAVLMLRGPQTPGEIKINVGRMAEFPDLAAVEAVLQRMESRAEPLVKRLARLPGKREERFAHLLCGDVAQPIPEPAAAAIRPSDRDARITALEAEVAALRAEMDSLWQLSGLSAHKPNA